MKTITRLMLGVTLVISVAANAQDTELAKSMQALNKEMDPQKKVYAMRDIVSKFKLDTLKNAEDIDVMKGEIALSFLNAGDFENFESYVNRIKNKFNQTSYLNSAAEILYKDTTRLGYAEVIAKKTVDLYEGYRKDPSARPTLFPLEAWNRFMRMAAFPYFDTYAKILHARGKDKAAFLYQEKALQDVELETIGQPPVERYTALLEKEQQDEKAYEILLKMATIGRSSSQMDAQLKRLYVKRTGDEAGARSFLESVQANVASAYKIEVARKMITDLKAPDFSLAGLDGKRMSLADLRGKVVVLDFWATWCSPCIASMPAMKQLSSQHPEVVFLFIATQESGVGAIARIKAYVQKNKFPVSVLVDAPTARYPKTFPVAAAYQLKGIPSKIVIDRNGKLRFSTDGYSSDKELINEMEAMIAITKTQ